MKKLYIILPIVTMLIVASCQATPTPLDPVSIQNTAVAMAWTSVSQTQNAPPTLQPTRVAPIVATKSSSSSSGGGSNTSWMSGGTLHKSTVKEWRQASYSNRLATSADFIAATQNVDYGDLDKFKQMATDLETCISTTAEGGAADNEKTAFISAICLVVLFPK